MNLLRERLGPWMAVAALASVGAVTVAIVLREPALSLAGESWCGASPPRCWRPSY